MKPSGPGSTLSTRAGTWRLSRTVVPSVPPGTSRPPTSAASIVRAQHAFVAAPAVVDGLAEAHRDRAVRQPHALDLDRLADARVVDELVRDPAHRRGRHVADRAPPIRASTAPCARRACANAVSPASTPVAQHVVVGADLDASASKRPSSASAMSGVSNGTAAPRARVPDQRLPRRAVAQVVAVRADEIRRGRVPREERDVEPLARDLVQQHVHSARTGTRRRSWA